MKYTVVWDSPAERELTQMWLGSRMRHAIKEAADRIDAALQRSPHDCGESRDAGRRIMLEPPVGILFAVDESERRVRVVSVWQF
jgi:hypothetical protein